MLYRVISFAHSDTHSESNQPGSGLVAFLMHLASLEHVSITICQEKDTPVVLIEIPDELNIMDSQDYGVWLSVVTGTTAKRMQNEQFLSRRETRVTGSSTKGNGHTKNVRIIGIDEATALFYNVPYSMFCNGATMSLHISGINSNKVRTDNEYHYYSDHPPRFVMSIAVSAASTLLSNILCLDLFEPGSSVPSKTDLYSAQETENMLTALMNYISQIVETNLLATQQKMPYTLIDKRYKKSDGPVVGFYRNNKTHTICLPNNENTVIIGASGSGKTVLTGKLANASLERGNSVIIISPLKRDYRDLLTKVKCRNRIYSATDPLHPLFLNPFATPLPYASSSAWFSTAEQMLHLLMSVGDVNESVIPALLRDSLTALFALKAARARNLVTFAECVHQQMHRREYKDAATLGEALRLRIREVADERVFFTSASNMDYEELFSPGITVVELDALNPTALRRIAGVLILSILFCAQNRQDQTTHCTLMLDEAHLLLGTAAANEHVNAVRDKLTDSLFETRASNLCTYLIDQRLEKIGKSTVLDGFPNRVFLRGNCSDDVKECLGEISAPLDKMQPSEGVYFHQGYTTPVFFTAVTDLGFRTDSEAIAKATVLLDKDAVIAKRFSFCSQCSNPDAAICERQIQRALAHFEKGVPRVDNPCNCSDYILNDLHRLHGGFYNPRNTKKG